MLNFNTTSPNMRKYKWYGEKESSRCFPVIPSPGIKALFLFKRRAFPLYRLMMLFLTRIMDTSIKPDG